MVDTKEVWKDIPQYGGKYQASSLGRIWSVKHQRVLKPFLEKNGYYRTYLYAPDGKRKKEYVHRMIAMTFLDNPDNLPQVNHKDEDRQNNNVENLEWCTAQYNVNYGNRFVKYKISRYGKDYDEETKKYQSKEVA